MQYAGVVCLREIRNRFLDAACVSTLGSSRPFLTLSSKNLGRWPASNSGRPSQQLNRSSLQFVPTICQTACLEAGYEMQGEPLNGKVFASGHFHQGVVRLSLAFWLSLCSMQRDAEEPTTTSRSFTPAWRAMTMPGSISTRGLAAPSCNSWRLFFRLYGLVPRHQWYMQTYPRHESPKVQRRILGMWVSLCRVVMWSDSSGTLSC